LARASVSSLERSRPSLAGGGVCPAPPRRLDGGLRRRHRFGHPRTRAARSRPRVIASAASAIARNGSGVISSFKEVASVDRRRGRPATWADGLALLALCWVPVLLTAMRLIATIREHAFAVDFHHYWLSGTYVLHGRSPFPPPTPDAALLLHSYPAGPYPAPVPVFFAPFGLLPAWLGDALFTAALIVALVLALHLAGVRDWRCYGAAFLWAPVAFGIQTANLTLLLLLGLALLWRLRDKVLGTAIVLGSVISLKLFLWPLVVWLLATRRYMAAVWSVILAVLIMLLSWAILGFAGFQDYPRVARIYARLFGPSTYTPSALLEKMGVAGSWLTIGGLAIGVAALGAIIIAARRSRSDKAAFTFAVGAALLCTPIVWLHYFALLLVPLAVLSPVFSIAWALPVILWACPGGATPTSTWKLALPLVVCSVTLLWAYHDEWMRRRVHRLPAT
jgi:Glycosyltransferase family 87